MCGLDSEVSRPELGGLDRRSVNHELIRLQVKCGRCFQTSHVGPVAELSLSIASNDLPVVDQWFVVPDLIVAPELQN